MTRKKTTALTKERFVETFQAKLGIQKKQAEECVDMIVEEIKIGLENDGKVKIAGFGIWKVNHKKARPGRNPHTGEKMEITERKVVSFNPSDKLRALMNKDLTEG